MIQTVMFDAEVWDEIEKYWQEMEASGVTTLPPPAPPLTVRSIDMDGLTPGRIVHYVSDDGSHVPAIVTAVIDTSAGLVNLSIFEPLKAPRALHWSFAYSEKPEAATWHWIEKA